MEKATIRASDNGPLLVKGTFSLLDGEGNEYKIARATIALCRCGHSSNKPFCDGTHSRIGFRNQPRVESDPDARSA